LAKVRAVTRLAPADLSVAAHSLTVAPVVATSSMRRTFAGILPRTLKAAFTFFILASGFSPRWEGVLRARRRSEVEKGIFRSFEMLFAMRADWL